MTDVEQKDSSQPQQPAQPPTQQTQYPPGPAYPPSQELYPPSQPVEQKDSSQPQQPAQPPTQQTQYPPGPAYPPSQELYPPSQPGYPPQQVYPPPGTEPDQVAPPPYNAGANPPPSQAQTIVETTVHSVFMADGQAFGETPANVQCPNCKNNVTSELTYENGMLVIILVFVIAVLFQLWCGCCLIPTLIKSLKDVNHTCPVCSYRLGTFKRIS